jgi:aminoglycoside phosphotransferase (APT) family kinase protein
MGLLRAGEQPTVTPLPGGVSSDIVRVDLADGPVCVKRALPRLKVEADWHAPVERNRYEVEWIRTAARSVPRAVPRVLGEDRDAGMFAMQFLDPAAFPVWKAQLRDGQVSLDTARDVGGLVATIHAHTADSPEIAGRFATDALFFAIRLEPYLRATATRHPDRAERLECLLHTTSGTRRALVHGDVSPKNILIGPDGPVLIDAECAWYGDPAFDLAFCLNHLLLKCAWRPEWQATYLECFDTLAAAYLAGVTWEPRVEIERRAAHLLPALFLARVDGKSPVEYITAETARNQVRRVARALLQDPVDRLADVGATWQREIAR